MKLFSIGQVARQAGVGIETVRFYERQGLLSEPDRKPSGYRQYTGDAVARLKFIRRAKELGFSLKEIAELMALRLEPGATCGDVRQRATEKLAEIEAKIRDLRRMKKALEELTVACKGRGPLKGCSILETLDFAEENDGEH